MPVVSVTRARKTAPWYGEQDVNGGHVGIDTWCAGGGVTAAELAAVQRVRDARRIVRDRSGAISIDGDGDLVGWLPPLYPEWLGDRSFAEAHGIRFPYATGSMANGIA